MEYNIDILVAGCNTSCQHCYVNGGYEKSMSFENYQKCIQILKPVFEKLNKTCSFTLDNEVYNHPQALEILQLTHQMVHDYYFHHGSTTGIALMNRKDKDDILSLLIKYDTPYAGLTFHGGKKHHNEIVHNEQGFDTLKDTAIYLHEKGIKVFLSFMISQYLINDLAAIDQLLHEIPYDSFYFVIPNFMPTTRMMKYQKIRLTYEDYSILFDFMDQRHIDSVQIKQQAASFNEKNILASLNEDYLKKFFANEPKQAFFKVDQQLNFYYGDTGAVSQRIGNLKEMTSEEILDAILQAKPNYYDSSLIHLRNYSHDQLFHLPPSDKNYVYPDIASCLYYLILKQNPVIGENQ